MNWPRPVLIGCSKTNWMIWFVKLLGFWIFRIIWYIYFVRALPAPYYKNIDWPLNSLNLLILKLVQPRIAHVRPWNGFVRRIKSCVCAVVHAPDHCRLLLLNVVFLICWIYAASCWGWLEAMAHLIIDESLLRMMMFPTSFKWAKPSGKPA